MSSLQPHRIFVIIQSMSSIRPNQLKLISLKAGLLQVYLEVMYDKAVFSLSFIHFCYYFQGMKQLDFAASCDLLPARASI